MTTTRWLVIGFFVALFLFAKGWILTHPRGLFALIAGAAILILSESSNAE
jgi:hypothetical protein